MAAPVQNKLVFVVDDEETSLKAIAPKLEALGYQPRLFADGRAALDALAQGVRPFAMLVDLFMPGIDGVVFRREQLQQAAFAELPLVVMTTTRIENELRASVGVPLLTKPITQEQLEAALELIAKASVAR